MNPDKKSNIPPRENVQKYGPNFRIYPNANIVDQSGEVDPALGVPGLNDHSPRVARFLAKV